MRRKTSTIRKDQPAPLAALLAVVVLYFPLIFTLPANWDEFHFLSHVYSHQRGDLAIALQTAYVWLFYPVTLVPGDEIGQLHIARAVYYFLLLGSSAILYFVARRFVSRHGALAAVLLFLSTGEVIRHAITFRYDGLSLLPMLGAVALIVTRRNLWAAGILFGLSFVVSIKAVLYIPTLCIFLFACSDRKARIAPFLQFGLAGLSTSGTLLFLHGMSLPGASLYTAVTGIANAGTTTLGSGELFPQWPYLGRSILLNPVTWILILFGLFYALFGKPKYRAEALALAAPLATLIFYRNSFPYFYTYILPLPAILAGMAIDSIPSRHKWPFGLRDFVIFAAVLQFTFHYGGVRSKDSTWQRTVIQVVHRMYPSPVTYIDRSSMIASFPKAGFFMSGWGFANYLNRGVPVFEDMLADQAPAFVLANHPALRVALDSTSPIPSQRLLEHDEAVLRGSFIPHWGPIYVAGARVAVEAEEPVRLQIWVPGTYTLYSTAAIGIDGNKLLPGGTVHLRKGTVSISSDSRQEIILRLGKLRYRPVAEPLDEPLFEPF